MTFKKYNLEEILNTSSLEEIIVEYGVDLERSSNDYIAHCPFHDDVKTKSFRLYTNTNSWSCFGCRRGGTVFDFIMFYDEVPFGKAVETLAIRAGISASALGDLNISYTNIAYDYAELLKDIEIESVKLLRKKYFYLKTRCNIEQNNELYNKIDNIWKWYDATRVKFDKRILNLKYLKREERAVKEQETYTFLINKLKDFYQAFVKKTEELV